MFDPSGAAHDFSTVQDLLFPDAWAARLTQAALLMVWLVPAILVYGYLADLTVFEGQGRLKALPFGRLDLAIGSLLAAFFVLTVVLGFRAEAAKSFTPPPLPGPADMIVGTLISAAVFLVVIGGILASLSARQISWRECFGLMRLGPVPVFGRAVLLIVMALPLITGALVLARVLLAAGGYIDDSPQDIVTFLAHNHSAAARWVVAVFAIFVAPAQEEFLFRGYLYGIMRRYAGPTVGIVLNAALFAAIHLHLPSFGGLFVLAVCLTLAYEWSGSLFVPITMHALFNAFSVVALLGGGATGL